MRGPSSGPSRSTKDVCHKHGAYLAFDEVKTGATLAWGGGIEAFGVTPDLACFAKATGGGLPIGAIGGVPEIMELVERGKVDQVGTFNGNPLTMAAARAALTEVLTRDAYARFDELNAILNAGSQPHTGQGVSRWAGDRRSAELPGVAVAAEPGRVQVALGEVGELDDVDRAHRRGRAALRRQLRRARRRPDVSIAARADDL